MPVLKNTLRPSNCALVASTVAALVLAVGGLPDQCHSAGVIVDSAGFESPTYSVGALQTQNGWVTVGGHAGTATVQSTTPGPSSARSLEVDRGPNSDDYWFVPKLGYPTQRYVTIDWDMLVKPSSSGSFGPFFGIRSFDSHGLASPGVLGTLGVDATTGDVLYETGTQFTETGTHASFNTWHHYRLVLDFTSMNYQGFLDGGHLITTAFADLALGVNDFTDADIATVAAGGDSLSQLATGTSFFDNFVIRDGLLGDYDLNGTVDANDYITWKQTFGSNVATAGNGADGNGNGKVDAADYTIWRDHLGQSLFSGTGAGSGSLAASAVPEPGALLLLLSGLVTIICRSAWRRQCASA
jgi:hypothetical protein